MLFLNMLCNFASPWKILPDRLNFEKKTLKSIWDHLLGTLGQVTLPNGMKCWKSSKGGGVIFKPKIYIANFGPFYRAFSDFF